METNRHIKKYGSWTDERSEIASGDLKKPYVAYIEEDEKIDYNDYAEEGYAKEYFTIVVDEPGQLGVTGMAGRKMEYSVDGTNWVAFDSIPLTLPITGDFFPRKIHFRGVNTTLASSSAYTRFTYIDGSYTKPFNAEGNIMSLLYGEDFANKTSFPEGSTHTFRRLFSGAEIISAKNLILPATQLVTSCYQEMFETASNFVNAPEFPEAALANNCYRSLFYHCGKLNWVKCLADPSSITSAFRNWMQGVSTTGTFVKKAGVTWPTGVSGIPTGWTVEEV